MLDGGPVKNRRQSDSDGIVIIGKRSCQIMNLINYKKIVSSDLIRYKKKFDGAVDLCTPHLNLIDIWLGARAGPACLAIYMTQMFAEETFMYK